MAPLDHPEITTHPHVTGHPPGPRSTELLARRNRRESTAQAYPRHISIAIDEVFRRFIRDLDGNAFTDFPTGAGVLSLGHDHPEPVRAVNDRPGRFTHGLDLPTPAKEAFVESQLSMLPAVMRNKTRIHFCGPTGANAVDAAIKLCGTATARGDVVSFRGGFHGAAHVGTALTGLVPGVRSFPYPNCTGCPMGLIREIRATHCIGLLERSPRDPDLSIALPTAVMLEMVQGAGGVVAADRDFVRRLRALTRELDIPGPTVGIPDAGRRPPSSGRRGTTPLRPGGPTRGGGCQPHGRSWPRGQLSNPVGPHTAGAPQKWINPKKSANSLLDGGGPSCRSSRFRRISTKSGCTSTSSPSSGMSST